MNRKVGNEHKKRSFFSIPSSVIFVVAFFWVLLFWLCASREVLSLHAGSPLDLAFFIESALFFDGQGILFPGNPFIQHFFGWLPLARPFALFGYRGLLLLQTFILGLGGVAVFFIARKKIPDFPALCMAGVYFLHPYTQSIALADFRFLTFMPGVLPLWFWLIEEKSCRPKWDYAIVISGWVIALLREDVALGMIFISIAVVLFHWMPRKKGALLLAGCIIIMIIEMMIIKHVSGVTHNNLNFYSHFGESGPEILKNIIVHPWKAIRLSFQWERLRFLLILAAGFSFLPFIGWRFLLAALPGMTLILLSNDPGPYSFAYHKTYYFAIPFALLTLASIEGAGKSWLFFCSVFQNRILVSRIWGVFLVLVCAAFMLFFSPFLQSGKEALRLFSSLPEKAQSLQKIKKRIPEKTSVQASLSALLVLAGKYRLYPLYQENHTRLADYVLHEIKPGEPSRKTFEDLHYWMKNNSYRPVESEKFWVLLKRNDSVTPAVHPNSMRIIQNQSPGPQWRFFSSRDRGNREEPYPPCVFHSYPGETWAWVKKINEAEFTGDYKDETTTSSQYFALESSWSIPYGAGGWNGPCIQLIWPEKQSLRLILYDRYNGGVSLSLDVPGKEPRRFRNLTMFFEPTILRMEIGPENITCYVADGYDNEPGPWEKAAVIKREGVLYEMPEWAAAGKGDARKLLYEGNKEKGYSGNTIRLDLQYFAWGRYVRE